MANNDILRTIRESLNLDDETTVQIFKAAGLEMGQSTIDAFSKTAEEDDYIPCSNPIMGFFLEGLIIHNRGQEEGKPLPTANPVQELTNNDILKKLRIALDLKEDDLAETLKLADIVISKQEISALFRKQGNKHYRECNDQLLGGFIKGLGLRGK
ncbi:MAG: DUF1456 family protein [Geobacteraceae bacterium]|nr:DUF1456 family protein [Geobacteraceae bacterium]